MIERIFREGTYLIDSHFHFAVMEEKEIDLTGVKASLEANGVRGGIDIAVQLQDLEERIARLSDLPGFGYSIGLYPSHADEEDIDARLSELETLLKDKSADPRLLALGEIGIDNHWHYGTPEKQRRLFSGQLELAGRYNFPVIIHNREADEEIYDELTRHSARGIMHCYSSDRDYMERIVDLGMYISFAGNLTFKKAVELQDAARHVPLDRVLFETDSPYLTPVPHRGKLNSPDKVVHTYQFFADLRHMDIAELAARVEENFNRVVPRYAAIRG